MNANRHMRALVTGGTQGIGAGVSHALAAAGYAVVACGLSAEECGAMVPDPGITTKVLDVTSDASVASAFAALDGLDLLVNCAGIIQRGGAEFTMAGFSRTLEVNLVGTMRTCVAARPLLAERAGSIVNTASMLTFHGSSVVPGYAASKGGVGQLTKSLAAAWAGEGVRVNAVAPGWIDTRLTRPLVDDAARSATILARTPLNRWGKPEDIAGAVVFLASDAARFITGVVLPVDGGYLAV